MVALLVSPHEVGGAGIRSARESAGGLVRRELAEHQRNPPPPALAPLTRYTNWTMSLLEKIGGTSRLRNLVYNSGGTLMSAR